MLMPYSRSTYEGRHIETIDTLKSHYHFFKFADLIRKLNTATVLVDAATLPDGTYESNDPDFVDLDIALEKHESVLISLFYAVQAVEAKRAVAYELEAAELDESGGRVPAALRPARSGLDGNTSSRLQTSIPLKRSPSERAANLSCQKERLRAYASYQTPLYS
jgi:hypothetical protein